MLTNDPQKEKLKLTVRGQVEKFAIISSKTISLRGVKGTEISKSITIVPVEKCRFKILGAKARKGTFISYTLSEKQDSGKTEYILTVQNQKQDNGSYHDIIDLTTDSKIQPVMNIRVFGNIFENNEKEKLSRKSKAGPYNRQPIRNLKSQNVTSQNPWDF